MPKTDGRIKVLTVSASLGKGGAERVLTLLARHLDRRLFAPEMAIFDLPISYVVPDDVPVHILSQRPPPHSHPTIPVPPDLALRHGNDFRWVERAASKLSDLVRELKPDVIISSPIWASIMTAVASNLFPPSTHVVNRGDAPPTLWLADSPFREMYTYLIREYYPRADEIVAVSGGVASDLSENFGVDASRIRVIYNPANIEDVVGMSQEPLEDSAFAEDIPTILFVGRHERSKGVEFLLRAVAQIVSRTPVNCVLIGDGSQKGYLVALTKHLGIEKHVRFLGRQNNPFKYMAKATMLVLPSLTEGMSNVMVEALVCRCPVIATDIDGKTTQELLEDGACGLIVPREDVDALAQAITSLLENPNLRGQLAREGFRRALDFDLPTIIRQYEEVILAAANSEAQPRGAQQADVLATEDSDADIQDGTPDAIEESAAQAPLPPEAPSSAPVTRLSFLWRSAGAARRRARAFAAGLFPRKASPGVRRKSASEASVGLGNGPKKEGATRLMVVVPALPETDAGIGLRAVMRHLCRRGYEVSVVTLSDESGQSPVREDIQQYSLEKYQARSSIDPTAITDTVAEGSASDLGWLAAEAAKVAGMALDFEADAILADGYDAARLALIAKRWLVPDVPVVVHTQDRVCVVANRPHGELDSALLREYFGSADGVLTSNTDTASELAEMFDSLREKVAVVSLADAIDVEAVMSCSDHAAAELAGASSAAPRFVCVVKQGDEAGLTLLLQALGLASKKAQFKVQVVVSGFGGDELNGVAQSMDLSPDTVEFIQDPVWSNRLLEDAVALIHPATGTVSGVPESIIRATALGCPVIATQTSRALVELLDQDGPGLSVKLGDPQGLAEAMLQLLWDSEARRELGLRGPGRLQTLSAETAAAKLDAVIQGLASAREQASGQ